MLKRHNQLMLAVLRAGDLIGCLCAFYITWGVAPLVHPAGAFNPTVAGATAMAALLLLVPVFTRLGLYSPQRTRGFFREFTALCRGVCVVWCLSYVAASLLIGDRPSRVVMGLLLPIWMLVAGVLRLIGRSILREARKRGWNLRHAAIVGTGRLGQTLYHTLKRNKWMGIETRFFIHATPDETTLMGKKVLGPYEDLERIVRDESIEIVFLAIPAREHETLERLLELLSQTRVDVRVVPDMLSYNLLRHEMEQLDNLPVVNLTHTPLQGWNALLKRLLDVAVSAVTLVVISPVLLVLAGVVKASGPGPVFYRQVRTSLGGEPFTIVKFRTMVDGAEDATGAIWSDGDADPRVTRVGRFMRRWNLDELPQFWNVFLGHMSLVGPRPERPELVERFGKKIPRYMLRQHARAGLTGWAQVNGLRGRTSLRKRVQYDLFYLCNWSVGFDLKILVMTLNPFGGKRPVRPVEDHDEAMTEAPRVPGATRTADTRPAAEGSRPAAGDPDHPTGGRPAVAG